MLSFLGQVTYSSGFILCTFNFVHEYFDTIGWAMYVACKNRVEHLTLRSHLFIWFKCAVIEFFYL